MRWLCAATLLPPAVVLIALSPWLAQMALR
jgi:hypothetical protein